MSSFVIVYLLGAAVMLALIANDGGRYTSPEILCMCLPFIFALDFFLRFTVQQTPSQMVKPYLLLPLPRNTCVNHFVATSVVSWGNAVWLIMVVPFCLMSVVFSYGLWPSFLLIVYCWLLAMANSQWYAIVRTLINDSLLWWLLPVAFYALLLVPMVLLDGAAGDLFLQAVTMPGEQIAAGNPLPLLFAAALLALLIKANVATQQQHVMKEVQAVEKTKEVRSAKSYAF